MKSYLEAFLREKPFFFAVIRPKEAAYYQPYKPFVRPILDFGCGDGFFSQLAFGKVEVGLDVDEKSLKEAQWRHIYSQVVRYDGSKIPFPDNYFATIVCNSVLEHVPNLDYSLKEISRVLKKGGSVYFTAPTSYWPDYLLGKRVLGRRYQRYFIKKSRHFNLYHFLQWRRELAKHGLQVTDNHYYLDSLWLMFLFDLSHYLSAFSLLSKRLLGRWVILPKKAVLFRPFYHLLLTEKKDRGKRGAYLFVAATKP